MQSREQLLSTSLPKWPQCLITGELVTEDQAFEIIRRTDHFLTRGRGGNDHEGDMALAARLRLPHFEGFGAVRLDKIDWDQRERWRAAWKIVDTEYISNSWISNASIFGPHGWCSPGGFIGYAYNVGKWPSVEDILKDLATLASAFPFLRMGATLMDREASEENPEKLVSFEVVHGVVRLHDPEEHDVHKGHVDPSMHPLRLDGYLFRCVNMSPSQREHGLSEAWLARLEEYSRDLEPTWK